MPTDPYAAYGGKTITQNSTDPYAAYGGSIVTSAAIPVPALKPFTPNTNPVPVPSGNTIGAYTPSVTDRLRDMFSNSMVGHAVENALPKLADTLGMHPSETVNSPTYQAHRNQLIAPEYLQAGNPHGFIQGATHRGLQLLGEQTTPGSIAAYATGGKLLQGAGSAATGTGAGANVARTALKAFPKVLAGGAALSGVQHGSQMLRQLGEGDTTGAGENAFNLSADALMLGATRPKFPELVTSIPERINGYKSPVIPEPLSTASNVAKAIRPPARIPHGFEQQLSEQLPYIREYADRVGNPLHSQWEGELAARGLADENLAHYNSNFLAPHADVTVPLDSQEFALYQGDKGIGGKTNPTLGAINDRLTEINKLTSGTNNNATTGGSMRDLEKLSDLKREGEMLRSRLYSTLSSRTGVPEADIQALREGYGQQFGIADVIGAARRARLNQIGAAEEGSQSIPFSKAGILEKGLDKLRGGREFIADARFRKALKPIQAKPYLKPMPK